MKKRVLIIGLFLNKEKNIPTQALELSILLRNRGYEVLTVSDKKNKILRLLHTIWFIILYRSRYDVAMIQVYSGLSTYWEYVSTFFLKLFHKKIILIIRGGGLPAKMKINPSFYLKVLRRGDVIVCPSTFLMQTMNEYKLKSQLVENVIATNNYIYQERDTIEPVFLWMRALSPIYNPEMAVRVINELKNTYKYENVKLYMGGPDMGLQQTVIQLIKEYKLNDNIELVGFLNMKSKSHYASLCSAYICTNNVDNAPVSFLEMMAFGLPIVSTNVGGIPHLVTNNKTALLVDKDDHVAMAERLHYLISTPGVAKSLRDNCKSILHFYSEGEVFNKWDKLLDKL